MIVSGNLIKYVLTAALRDRLFLSFLLLILVGMSLSIFFGSSAIIEKNQFALVFAGGGLRTAGIAGLVLFTVFHIARSFDSRDVDFLLSRPISRASFLLSHAVAFSLLAIIMAACISGALLIITGPALRHGLMIWGLTLGTEYIIIVNVALFFSMVLPSAASSAMAVLAFYVLARLMGQILGIIDGHVYYGQGSDMLTWIMQVISLVMPRLDLMGQTSWLIYGAAGAKLTLIFLQGLFYPLFICAAGYVDLSRRQF